MPRNIRLVTDDTNTVTSILDPSTGISVDLSGLTPSEKALCLMLATVDPYTYGGDHSSACLVGQPANLARNQAPWNDDVSLRNLTQPELVSVVVGGSKDAICYIYEKATDDEYSDDLDEALRMAAVELGVDRDKCESLVAPLMEEIQ